MSDAIQVRVSLSHLTAVFAQFTHSPGLYMVYYCIVYLVRVAVVKLTASTCHIKTCDADLIFGEYGGSHSNPSTINATPKFSGVVCYSITP